MESAQKSDTLLNPPNLEQILPGLKLLSSGKNKNQSNAKTNPGTNESSLTNFQSNSHSIPHSNSNSNSNPISHSHSNINIHSANSHSQNLQLTNSQNSHHIYQDFNSESSECRKKLKNRESAQAARDRRKNRVVCLERQVADLSGRNKFLETENRDLKQRLQQYEADHLWRLMQHKAGSNKILEHSSNGATQTRGQNIQSHGVQNQPNMQNHNMHMHNLQNIPNQQIQQAQQQFHQNQLVQQAQQIPQNIQHHHSSYMNQKNTLENPENHADLKRKSSTTTSLVSNLSKVSDIQAYLSDEPVKKIRRTSRLPSFNDIAVLDTSNDLSMLPIGTSIDTDPVELAKLTNLLGRYNSGGASSSGDSGNKTCDTEFEAEIVEEWLMKNSF